MYWLSEISERSTHPFVMQCSKSSLKLTFAPLFQFSITSSSMLTRSLLIILFSVRISYALHTYDLFSSERSLYFVPSPFNSFESQSVSCFNLSSYLSLTLFSKSVLGSLNWSKDTKSLSISAKYTSGIKIYRSISAPPES